MKKILFLILIPLALYSQSNNDYTGTWQSSAVLASGWEDTFLFFEDSTFKFFYNQMDCAKRTVSYSGNWRVNDEEIILRINKRVILEGGKMVLSDGSCAGDSMLTGDIEKVLLVDPPETQVLKKIKYSVISIDGVERKTLTIDGQKYWYYGEPKEMLKQFEN